jgi:hypothetical protein
MLYFTRFLRMKSMVDGNEKIKEAYFSFASLLQYCSNQKNSYTPFTHERHSPINFI